MEEFQRRGRTGNAVVIMKLLMVMLSVFTAVKLVQKSIQGTAQVQAFSTRTTTISDITNNNKRGTSMTTSSSLRATTQYRILCYGDSLTAGTNENLSPLEPYGPHLEKALSEIALRESEGDGTSSSSPSFVVRWKGFPGMTAETMSQSLDDTTIGLRAALKKVQNPSIALAIILAGTNDLATEFYRSGDDHEEGAGRISDSVIKLHEAAHSMGIPTLGISIPTSGWQSSSSEARDMSSTVNGNIETWCKFQTSPKAYFVEHPIETWSRDDTRWASDGLHFSAEGYKVIGQSLAPIVYDILVHKDNVEGDKI